MPKTLFILNDPPYGTERSYNALRLAGSLSKPRRKGGLRRRRLLRGTEARGDLTSAKLALASRQGVGRENVALHQALNVGGCDGETD